MKVVISYDISDDKRRRKVAQVLEGYGYRVQYSVFECELDSQKMRSLKQQLRPLVKAAQWESIRFYPLFTECAEKATVMGKDLARALNPLEII